MESWYATSADGEIWDLHGPALQPTPGSWDQRGARIAAVVNDVDAPGGQPTWIALYDGRASAKENWLERTGVAVGTDPGAFSPVGTEPLVGAPSLRYATVVQRPAGDWLVYYEAERADGSHDLRVENAPRSTGASQSS